MAEWELGSMNVDFGNILTIHCVTFKPSHDDVVLSSHPETFSAKRMGGK